MYLVTRPTAPPARRGNRLVDAVDRNFKWLTLGPAGLLLVGLTIYPMLNLLGMAVSTIRFERAREIWSFTPGANFDLLLHDQVFRTALWNTLLFAAASVAVEMVLGLVLAILASSITAFKGLVRSALIIPILMPPVAIGSMWKLMYSYDFGVLNQIVTGLGLQPVNWTGSTSLALMSVVLVDVWHWTPFVFLILFAAVEGLPKEIVEAARMDGARTLAVVFRIMIPLLRPALVVAALFRAILAFKVFDQVFLLTSGGPGTSTEVVSLYLFKVFFQQNQLGYGALLSLAIIAATIAFLLMARQVTAAVPRS